MSVLRGVLAMLLLALALHAQQVPDTSARSLPDIAALMHDVERHQKAAEALVRDYIYHAVAKMQAMDGHGVVKHTQTEEADVFYVAGAEIRHTTKKDGKDLSPDEERKESEQVDKEIAKAKKKQGKPQEEDKDDVTVSRFLELGSFSNARRVTLDGRDTIAVDFTGDPHAKTRSRAEGAIREMAGTVWVDEQDRAMRKVEGLFLNDFKIGGGVLADIKKGASFHAEWRKVNNEVWLPASFGGKGSLRALLLLNVHGTLQVTNSGYRKFRASAIILPPEPGRTALPPQP